MVDRNVSNPNDHTQICASARANDVAPDDPNHSITGVSFQSQSYPHHHMILIAYAPLVFDTYQPDEGLVNSSPAGKYEKMDGYVDCLLLC